MATAPKTAPKLVSKEAAPAADGGAPVVKKKSKKKAILISAVVAIMLGGAGGAAFFLTGDEPAPVDPDNPDAPVAEAKPAKVEPVKPPRFLKIDPFTVNLQHEAPGAPDQFLQIEFSIQLADDKQEELIKQYLPQVRSRLLLLLSGKKASEINTVEGKKKLAEEIAEQLKIPFIAQLPPLEVNNVFFTSFVIQ